MTARAIALLLLAACGDTRDDAQARCQDAIAKIDERSRGQRAVALAHACADTETGACRDVMRHLEDVGPEARAARIWEACGRDGARQLRDALLADEQAPAPDAATPGTLITVHADSVDVAWNGLTLHLARDCPPLLAAFDSQHVTEPLTVVADPDIPYSTVVDIVDCAKQRFTRIGFGL